MPGLEPLRAEHAAQILAFEWENRARFASSVSDRGDHWFDHFADRCNGVLADQEAGLGAPHVLVAADGSVTGRFTVFFQGDGFAHLGHGDGCGQRDLTDPGP